MLRLSSIRNDCQSKKELQVENRKTSIFQTLQRIKSKFEKIQAEEAILDSALSDVSYHTEDKESSLNIEDNGYFNMNHIPERFSDSLPSDKLEHNFYSFQNEYSIPHKTQNIIRTFEIKIEPSTLKLRIFRIQSQVQVKVESTHQDDVNQKSVNLKNRMKKFKLAMVPPQEP